MFRPGILLSGCFWTTCQRGRKMSSAKITLSRNELSLDACAELGRALANKWSNVCDFVISHTDKVKADINDDDGAKELRVILKRALPEMNPSGCPLLTLSAGSNLLTGSDPVPRSNCD